MKKVTTSTPTINFTKYLIAEDKQSISNLEKQVYLTSYSIKRLQTIFESVKTQTGFEKDYTMATIIEMLNSESAKTFVFDSIMKGAEMKAGEHFPITREASMQMFAFCSEVNALQMEINTLNSLKHFLPVFIESKGAISVNTLELEAQKDHFRSYTNTPSESTAYELILKMAESINEALNCLQERNGDILQGVNLNSLIKAETIVDSFGWMRNRYTIHDNVINVIREELRQQSIRKPKN